MNSILRFGRRVIDLTLEKNIGINSKDIESEIENIRSDFKTHGSHAYESILETYNDHLLSKQSFKAALEEISSIIPIVILVDELDRCRPTYAIETLEVIKHYFDVPNIVYVFAIDLEQLSHSVSTIYGQNMDSHGYLRKFFDVISSLPRPQIKQYLNSKYHEAQSVTDKSHNTLMNEKLIPPIISSILEFNLSLREIDSLLPSVHLLSIKLGNDLMGFQFKQGTSYNNIYSVIFYLFFLKHKEQASYDYMLNEVFSFTSSNLDMKLPQSSQPGVDTLKELLQFGNNKSMNILSNGLSENNFKGDLCKLLIQLAGKQNPEPSSLGEFLHNYIESSLAIITQF